MKEISQDLRDDAFVQNPYPFYDRARDLGPVLFWKEMGMLAAFDHASVSALLRDRRLGRTPPVPRDAPVHLAAFRALELDSLLELEPPRHTRLRGLVLRAFTSRRINALRPDIVEITKELLANIPRNEAFDLIPSYCQPLPVRIIARLLGVPETMSDQLLVWSRDMVAMYQTGVTEEIERRAGASAQEFTDFMRGYVDARRDQPADDLITHLIAAEEDGQKLSTDEMISTCILLLNAGHEATVHSLGNATRVLIEHAITPTEENAAQIGEEVLRLEAPLHVFTRFASETFDIAPDITIKKGEEIALVLGAANRDPTVFPQPHQFDPMRSAVKQTSFGGGLHFCVGAPLARAELQIGLSMLFANLQNLQIAKPAKFANTYHFHKHDELWVMSS